jgi:hypothetical protein
METIELTLTLDHVNVIMAGLGKLPYEAAFQTVEEVKAQASAQLKNQQQSAAAPQPTE